MELSKEEKEAIELLTKRYDFFNNNNQLATNVWLTLDIHNLGVLLKLIPKLQEELNSDIKIEINEDYIKVRDKCFYIKQLQGEFGQEIKRLKQENEELKKYDYRQFKCAGIELEEGD